MVGVTDRLAELFELRSATLLDIDDGGRLLVGDDESGSTQLHELAPDGTRVVLTDLGEPCSGRYLPGERAVIVSADDGGTERAQLWLLRLDGDAELEPLVRDPAYIHTLLDVLPDRVLYATNRRNGVDFDVVLRTVSSGDETVIWDGGGWVNTAAVSPDGRYIAMQREALLPASQHSDAGRHRDGRGRLDHRRDAARRLDSTGLAGRRADLGLGRRGGVPFGAPLRPVDGVVVDIAGRARQRSPRLART